MREFPKSDWPDIKEEFAIALEKWLKERRDQYSYGGDHWEGVNSLLDDTRSGLCIGKLPWEITDDDLPYG